MVIVKQFSMQSLWIVVSAVTVLLTGYSGTVLGDVTRVTLSGKQEIPPVTTSASGIGIIDVRADRSIRGTVTISGMTVTAAHIHEAPAGKNGPIAIPLIRISDSIWSVPEGAKLTDAQYESYKAGHLYFNIHSVTHRAGEIRGQIKQ